MTDHAEEIRNQLLVLRCQAGDQSAFAEIVERFQKRLRYYVSKLNDDDTTTDDILQTVWLAAFRGLKTLKSPEALSTWLYTIARRTVMREWNRPQFDRGVIPNGEFLVADDEPQFAAEDAARIHAALHRLSPPHREVLVLRFLEEMSYDDIAHVTGTELGTVRSRLYYAKRMMKEILEPENSDE